MKFILAALTIIPMMGFYGCNRSSDTGKAGVNNTGPNDATVERQDDYQQGNMNEARDYKDSTETKVED